MPALSVAVKSGTVFHSDEKLSTYPWFVSRPSPTMLGIDAPIADQACGSQYATGPLKLRALRNSVHACAPVATPPTLRPAFGSGRLIQADPRNVPFERGVSGMPSGGISRRLLNCTSAASLRLTARASSNVQPGDENIVV